jgi:hypothetical protein
VKQIIERKYAVTNSPQLSDWQITRIEESHKQIKEGKHFSNYQADLLVEKWLNE